MSRLVFSHAPRYSARPYACANSAYVCPIWPKSARCASTLRVTSARMGSYLASSFLKSSSGSGAAMSLGRMSSLLFFSLRSSSRPARCAATRSNSSTRFRRAAATAPSFSTTVTMGGARRGIMDCTLSTLSTPSAPSHSCRRCSTRASLAAAAASVSRRERDFSRRPLFRCVLCGRVHRSPNWARILASDASSWLSSSSASASTSPETRLSSRS
mmetsp:Transcript_40471/g.128963  ORF Transcript_40471/g.128963 Transcript_40471/m.128963 type:complete len:214 (+) Transcript_40471:221-862(+)